MLCIWCYGSDIELYCSWNAIQHPSATAGYSTKHIASVANILLEQTLMTSNVAISIKLPCWQAVHDRPSSIGTSLPVRPVSILQGQPSF